MQLYLPAETPPVRLGQAAEWAEREYVCVDLIQVLDTVQQHDLVKAEIKCWILNRVLIITLYKL